MNYFYKASEVKEAIGDRWYEVLAQIAPELIPAIEKAGRHTFCPVHGGRNGDAFRFFRKDGHLTGGAICNTCGPKNDGFELLQWLKGWDFKTTLNALGDCVGAPRHRKKRGKPDKNQLRQKGVILAHGAAPYNFNEKNSQSYFIQILSEQGGEHFVWGVDLERALNQAKADIDDHIAIYSSGREQVKVHSGAGHDVKAKSYYRNTFEIIVEKRSLKKQPASVFNEKQPEQRSKPIVDQQSNAQFGKQPPRQEFKQMPKRHVREQMQQSYRPRKQASQLKPKANTKSYAFRRIENLWNESIPLNTRLASSAYDYFKRRGFVTVLNEVAKADELRFHPALEYFAADGDGKMRSVGKFPALIGAIRNVQGELITLHRTYLFSDNPNNWARKKMMPLPDGASLTGGAIQLTEPTEGVLGVAEGIETALACMYASKLPVWAAVSAQFLATFEVPEDVHTVIIWADKDASYTGEKAAYELKRKLKKEGVKTVVALPQLAISNGKSVDWNDVLLEQGRIAFPNPVELRKFLGI